MSLYIGLRLTKSSTFEEKRGKGNPDYRLWMMKNTVEPACQSDIQHTQELNPGDASK